MKASSRSLRGNFLATARMSSILLLLFVAVAVNMAQLAMTALSWPTQLSVESDDNEGLEDTNLRRWWWDHLTCNQGCAT